mgnify:CR=1 FL=1
MIKVDQVSQSSSDGKGEGTADEATDGHWETSAKKILKPIQQIKESLRIWKCLQIQRKWKNLAHPIPAKFIFKFQVFRAFNVNLRKIIWLQ